MSARGSDRVIDQNFTLEARQLALNSTVSFICSRERGWNPGAGGSAGALCLGGVVGRFDGAVYPTGGEGRAEHLVDLMSIPQSGGFVAALVGDTWSFQAWYRDSAGGQPTSNLTDGLEVLFR
jgi:hypothetical protein